MTGKPSILLSKTPKHLPDTTARRRKCRQGIHVCLPGYLLAWSYPTRRLFIPVHVIPPVLASLCSEDTRKTVCTCR